MKPLHGAPALSVVLVPFAASLAACFACKPDGTSSVPTSAARPSATLPAVALAPESPRASGPVYVPELLAEGLAAPQGYALLSELCTRAPHRLAGSEGAARAVEWGREAMQRLGFENVRLEPVLVPHWERGTLEELVVVEPAAHSGARLAS
ncbi:MAG: hypothetical protein HOP15_09765, partial [Planctomycetes bacterium]|nr:hypothetical protein [Planctomycetota bacterium]